MIAKMNRRTRSNLPSSIADGLAGPRDQIGPGAVRADGGDQIPTEENLAQAQCLKSRNDSKRLQPMRRFLKDNGLTIALIALFLLSLVGMVVAGLSHVNETLMRHHRAPLGLFEYLKSGEFLSALFENWESEFLQMGVYVVLTAMLFQRGSAESRDPDQDRAPSSQRSSPAASRFYPAIEFLYAHSLGIALLALFAISFVFHVIASFRAAREEAAQHGAALAAFWPYLLDSGLWFESFQNWQSEFMSTAALVLLSIYLRQKSSPESKPVQASNQQTGD
ncbi:DUF6766 family protein [Brucella pituitosa]